MRCAHGSNVLRLVLIGAVILCAAATAAAQSAANLVAAYAYDEGSGTTAADQSVSSNTASVAGASWNAACKFGTCLSFDGAASYVESADHDGLTPGVEATFEAWVRLTAAPTEIVSIFNKWSQTADDEYLVGINPSRTLFFAWHTTGGTAWPSAAFNQANSVGTVPLNALTHIAVVRNGATLRFYINGTLDSSSAVMDTNPFRNGTNTMRIGGQGRGATNRFLTGTIDEARIYNRALSQVEIENDMKTPIAPMAEPDTTPPGLASVAVSAVTASAATLTWTTSEPSDAQVEYGLTTLYGSMTALDPVLTTSHSITVSGLAPATPYHVRVRSRDAAGNIAWSDDLTFTTLDGTAPSVSITTPADGATISGTTSVSATATDNVAVLGVQFKVDGVPVGAEDLAAPYAISWNTTTVSDGVHMVTVVARDAAGNLATGVGVSVTVANGAAPVDLVAAYAYDDGVGSTAGDASANHNIATLVDANWNTSCKFGACLSFNGASSVVEAPDLDVLTLGTEATLEAWVFLTAAPTETVSIVNKWSQSEEDEFLFGINPNRTLRFAWRTTGGNTWGSKAYNAFDGVQVIPLDTLTHVAVVRNGTKVSFYINGAPGASGSVMDMKPFRNGLNTLRIGGQGRGAKKRFLNGTIDEVRLYNRALTQIEIQDDMNTPIGPAAPDTTPPGISSVAVSSVTATSATITWLTNEAADSQLNYGPTTAYGSSSPLEPTLVTSHTVTLGGLTSATTYHARVQSSDAALNLALSGDITFTTLDVTPPVVALTAPAPAATVQGTITVSATAIDNVGVAGVQFYIDGAPLGAEDTTNAYEVTWDTLTAANGIHMLTAVARDGAGNATTSAAVAVTAANDTTAPEITGAAASSITSSTATISWTTNEASDSQVEYGTTTAYGSVSPLDSARVTSHSMTVSGLASGTVYHFRVRSRDAAGNLAVSGDLTMTTVDDTPPVVSITTPAAGATVSGVVTATADAADNVAVVGVQFALNGAALGPEDLTAPYTVAWDTTAAANGSQTLTAVARDAAGNVKSSAAVAVTVDNNALADLVAAYSYDDGAGTAAADASVNNNAGAIFGATWSTACTFGTCLSFNGASFVESADIPALTLANEATFEAWVSLAAAPAETASIFNKWNQTADDEYLVGISPARALVFAWHTTGGGSWPSPSFNEAASTGTIPLNTLTHIAVVRSGATLAFYINGMLDSSLSVLDTNPFRNGANTLRIGGQSRGDGWAKNRFFTGAIDEARIYRRALTQGEIQADMNTPIGPDITPPELSAISASPVASSSATISWTTNESSDTQVEYGLTTAYGSATPVDSSLLTDHSVTVGALVPGTPYHYRVRSRDAAGNLAVSVDHTFTTTAGDVTPPTVSLTAPAANATISGIVTVSADAADNVGVVGVQFKLNGAALGLEDLTAPYTVAWDTTAAANGSQTLTAVARDAAGNVTSSAAVAVTVDNNPLADLVAAYSYNDGAGTTAADASVNNNTAAIFGTTWSTACTFGKCLSFNGASFVESADIPALTLATEATFEAWVSLAAAPAETASIFNKWNQTADDEYMVGISPARALYFAWHTTGTGTWPSPSFNEAASAGTIPLNTLTHIAVVRNGVTLSFYINGALDSSFNVLDTNSFRNGAATLRVGGQSRGAKNRFFAGVIDEARIYSRALSQGEIQADMNTPVGPDTTPPVLSAISAASVTSSSATIEWTTNESSDTQVEYGLTTAYGSTTPLNSSLLTDHSVTIGSLPASTLHHYRVRSRDAGGNLAVSGDHTFTTAAVDSTPPTVSLTAPAADSTVSGIVTVSANAADNVGVAGVQFKLDGADLGFMDAAPPYMITWDTTATASGAHTLTAVARDAAGNTTSSTPITVTVTVATAEVMLAWDGNTEANLAGYRVYVGDASGVYTMSFDAGNVTTYTVTGLQVGRLYYFAVTAYDQSLNESGFSNEVSTTP